MKTRDGILLAVGGFLAGSGVWWLAGSPAGSSGKSAPPVPATVAKVAKESDFTTIVLTAEAEQKLALQTATLEKKPAGRARTYGGEVQVAAGHAIAVSAPVNGVLRAPPGGMPLPGQVVKSGQPIMQLLPLLTPEGRANLAVLKAEADGKVNTSKTTLEATQLARDRARKLLRGEAGSQRQVDDAEAAFEFAQKTLEKDTAARDQLQKFLGDSTAGTTAPVFIDSPEDGVLRVVSVSPGQGVPAGQLLFEVVDLDTVWVRVPVYAGDLTELAQGGNVNVRELHAKTSTPARPARRVAAPPAANALTGTVDLFFQFDNRETKYSPGQRVAVSLPLQGEAEALAVPLSAIVYDYHGGAWVYVVTAEHTYARRRVTVARTDGPTALLANGPKPGTVVVTAGAAELFGTETGFSK